MLVIINNMETPAYWIKSGKSSAARDVFNKMYPVKNLEKAELTMEEHEEAIDWLISREEKLVKEANPPPAQVEDKKKGFGGYNSALIGVYVWFFNQFTGLQGINSYSSTVLRTFTTPQTATLITVVLSFAGFLSAILATFYIDKSKRKTLLILGGFLCSISLAITAIFTWLNWVIFLQANFFTSFNKFLTNF